MLNAIDLRVILKGTPHDGMGIDEGQTWVKAKLKRSWQKLREDVQELVRDKYDTALKVL